MERLTSPNINVDPGTDRFLHAAIGGKEIDWKQSRDSTLNVLINGPTSNGFGKDIFRKMARDLYGRLKAYEDTGFEPEEVTALGKLFDYALKESKTLTEQLTLLKHIRELAEADKDGRCVVLPCRKGERWKGKDGRAVVVTGVSNFADGDRKYFEVYFDYENAASRDDADTDCAGNWEWFKCHFTREEAERALQEMEGRP